MDSGSSHYDKLINQCKSNDVDTKVEALVKLQTEFEKSSLQVPDPEALISILKSSLRTSNLHLCNATLFMLPATLRVLISPAATSAPSPINPPLTSSSSTSSAPPSNIIDVPTLRQALNAFLPAGGVIDRLGDKEKAQIKARDTLVILGGFAFRSGGANALASKSGKGVEAPITVFERCLKEGGLASKVWKVREQSILALVHIRRAHHLFPIRPYLPFLVDCLEDTDPHVRDCARSSVVELFSGPGVTDMARTDLKKEMTKKGVRRTIVDGVLNKLLGASVANPQIQGLSENGDENSQEYVPPSLVLQNKRPRVASQSGNIGRIAGQSSSREIPRPASRAGVMPSPPLPTPASESPEIQSVYIASCRDLESEFASMAKAFEGKETEHNWAQREQAIQRVRGMIKGEAHLKYSEPFFAALKDGFIQWSLKTLASLRTTVAVNTCLLYSEMAVALGPGLDPFCDVLLTNLLKMAAFTKKITAQGSQASVTAIINNTSPQPRVIVPLLWQTLQEKTVQARAYVIAHIKLYLENHGQRSKNAIESSGSLETLEKSLKKALADATPAVRETARVLFWVFEEIWRDRGLAIMETLDPTARKQLEKACPKPESQVPLPPSTPKATKKTSVAAAIAASRAKARAIATAPPSLRHQATSAHGAPLRRGASPSTSPHNSTARPGSPLSSSSSPSRPRGVSSTITRSTSTSAVPVSHARTHSSSSDKAERAHSPSLSDQGTQRRLSSPLATTSSGASIRRAIRTEPSSLSSAPMEQKPSTPGDHGLRSAPTPVPVRQSLAQLITSDEESLLVAQSVPIPGGDTDSEDEDSTNLMSFSAPFEMFPPIKAADTITEEPALSPLSLASESRPPESVSNALSSSSISDMTNQQPVVEDALRARAEQAESAAERLLELVEPEDDPTIQPPLLPTSLLKSSNGTTPPSSKTKPASLPIVHNKLALTTPKITRATSIMRQAASFVDSPARGSSSLLDVLQSQKQETGWWLKRKALLAQAAPIPGIVPAQEMENHIAALNSGKAGVPILKSLGLICMENAVAELSSPPSSPGDLLPSSPTPLNHSRPVSSLDATSKLWEENKTFDRFFKALTTYLDDTRSEDELAYGLIIVWEIIANQAPCLEGKESDLFATILRVRYCNKVTVLEGANAIRDALTAKLGPVYGLTTMHASLRVFHSEPVPNPDNEEVKAATYAFGLMALGKFILRLPAEIAEEELPRLKGTLITALNDKSSLIIRESAAACIIAAQLVLRDETHLFTLLDGLADDKKNLLTYLFDKHGARGSAEADGPSGMDKLEREIRRLDTHSPVKDGMNVLSIR